MNIRYFAWLRTKVGKAEEEVSPPADVTTVGDLMTWLAADRPGFAEAIGRKGRGARRRQSGLRRTRPPREARRRGRLLPPRHRRLGRKGKEALQP